MSNLNNDNAKKYMVNEVFYSIQGEGVRTGTANIFIRFSGCNMRCDVEPGPKSPGGFACDTEFTSGRLVTLDELRQWIVEVVTIATFDAKNSEIPKWIILTGGEPALQIDKEFCDYFHNAGYKLAIETNGSIELPKEQNGEDYTLDWITVSPKVAEHAIKQRWANEVKYVRGYGQAIPKTMVEAKYKLISPAFDGMQVHPKTLEWCNKLILENPEWRLTLQTHKLLSIR